jgi:hypothetical protein
MSHPTGGTPQVGQVAGENDVTRSSMRTFGSGTSSGLAGVGVVTTG